MGSKNIVYVSPTNWHGAARMVIDLVEISAVNKKKARGTIIIGFGVSKKKRRKIVLVSNAYCFAVNNRKFRNEIRFRDLFLLLLL